MTIVKKSSLTGINTGVGIAPTMQTVAFFGRHLERFAGAMHPANRGGCGREGTMTLCNSCDRNGCGACQRGPLGLWSQLDPVYARALDRITIELRQQQGEWVFRMGQPSCGVYCVASGVVGLRKLHANGAGVMLEIAYPGDLIGVPAFLRNEAHATGAEALTDVRLCRLPGAELRRLLGECPSLYPQLVRVCLDALDASQDAMLQAAAMSNRDRLFYLLKRLLEHCGNPDEGGHLQARLPISREDIAGMLGVRQETLSRLLKRLSDESLIEISGRHCRLLPQQPARTRQRRSISAGTRGASGF